METVAATHEQVAQHLLSNLQYTLIAEVEDYLRREGMTRTQFAVKLGVSKGYVSQFMNGKGNHSFQKIIEVSLAIRKYPQIIFTDPPSTRMYRMPEPNPSLLQEDETKYERKYNFLRRVNFDAMGKLSILSELTELKETIDTYRPFSEQRGYQILQKFRYAWNYNSNAIEGSELTYGETITLIREGLTAKGKPLKDHLDAQGHEKAVDMMLDMIKGDRSLNQHDIRQLHKLLLKETYLQPSLGDGGNYVFRTIHVGEYKRQPNHVRKRDNTIHYYADPIEVPARMGDLLDWYESVKNSDELHPLLAAAIFHHEFVAIHPFDDGNGRMGRILMNYTLMRRGYPPIVVPQKQRRAYYSALNQADSGNYLPLVEYLVKYLQLSLEVQYDAIKNGNIDPYHWDVS